MKKKLISTFTVPFLISACLCGCSGSRYTVKWVDADGTVLEIDVGVKNGDLPVFDGETPTKPADVQYTYTFAGWETEIEAVTADTTYVAKYNTTVNKYAITWLNYDGSVLRVDQVEYGTVPSYRGTPKKASSREYNYSFSGWQPAPVAVTGSTSYTAKYTESIRDYDVVFDANGGQFETGSSTEVKSVNYNDRTTRPETDPTREGYTFAGWVVDGEPANFQSLVITNDTTIVAQWTVNQYTITFDANGGSNVDPITQDYGTAVTAPTAPTREHYTFVGWSVDVPATMPAEDLTLVAQWELNKHTITFNLDGGVGTEEVTYEYGATVSAPADPTREGYTFDRWDTPLPATMPDEDVVITALWTINAHTITFDSNGGTAVAPITQDYGTAVTAPADPTREGYTFAGWDKDIPATMPDEDLVFTAKWTINTYTITFDLDGGVGTEEVTYEYGATVTAPANPTKEGFTFIGWNTPLPATMPAENLTFSAIWVINLYTIVFNSNGGTAVAPINQNYGTAITAPADPTRPGYTFAGWDKDIPATMPDGGLVLTAQWTPLYETVEEDGLLTITKYVGEDVETITIPNAIDGRTIEGVGAEAFRGLKNVKEIVLPSTVTRIGEKAFEGCSSLTTIVLPDGLKKIDARAFANCTSLTEIFIPASVKFIDVKAFSGCTQLANINCGASSQPVAWDDDWNAGCSATVNFGQTR